MYALRIFLLSTISRRLHESTQGFPLFTMDNVKCHVVVLTYLQASAPENNYSIRNLFI